MNHDIRWTVPSDGHTFPIYAGPADDLDRVAEYADERGVTHLRFGGDSWSLNFDPKSPEASAVTPTGTWTAVGDGSQFSRSKVYEVSADRHAITILEEKRGEFVLDIAGQKAGQFTSANRGVRNLHVEFEGPGAQLPLDVQIYLSWVARCVMASRMVSNATMWAVSLIIAALIIVVYFAQLAF